MKLIWVKAGGLVPPDAGGRIRSYHILRELAKKHAVTLFTFYPAHPNDLHPGLEGIFERVITCPLPVPADRGARQLLNYLGHFPSGRPFTVSKHCHPQVADALRQALARDSYDLILCDFVFSGGVIPWDALCPKVVFTHNVEALIWHRNFQVAGNPAWKLVSWIEYKRVERFERLCLEKADHVITVSEADRQAFSAFLDPRKITAIPTGVDTEYFRPSPSSERRNTIVFTGSMDWMPNEDAMLYFANEILPTLRKLVPDVTIAIVGRNPSRRLRELGRERGMEITGRVEDIRPHAHRAAVYVVPLRVGGGTRLKIFEAMAMGKAVVSTTVGAEGLPVTNGKDILLADDPKDFASSVAGLLRNDDDRRRLGRAARDLVAQRYGWASVAAAFEEILERVVRRQNLAVSCT
ncbi:MAG TPA: glycosyltransferase family 4 protein [Terriglobales bacterium]|nr:glycosyltransferase family 4 protein [Terriglobales bacterium]